MKEERERKTIKDGGEEREIGVGRERGDTNRTGRIKDRH